MPVQGLRRVSWTSSSHRNRSPSEAPATASCATPRSNRATLSAVVQSSCAREMIAAWLSGWLIPGLGRLFFLGAVVHFTDYSAGRSNPIKREVRLAPTPEAAEAIADAIIEKQIKKGWTRA